MNHVHLTPDRWAESAHSFSKNSHSAHLSGANRLSLVGLGLLSLLGYGWLAWRYPLAEHLAWPRGGWYPPQEAILSNLWVHLAVYGLLFVVYLLAMRAVSPRKDGERAEEEISTQRRRAAEDAKKSLSISSYPRLSAFISGHSSAFIVVIVWLVASVLLLWATPSGDSHDIYDYIYRGRLQVEQGISPLAVTPKAAPRMAYYAYTAWKENVDTYGPLWEYASGGVSWLVKRWLQTTGGFPPDNSDCPRSPLACRGLMIWVTGYRLLAIGLTGLSGWLIYRLVQGEFPAYALPALVTWLWNPSVLLSSALGAHNDGLMIVALLASLLAVQRRRWVWAFLLLGLAAHVKLTALIWAPVLGLWLWKQIGLRRALLAGVGAGVLLLPLSWLLYRPLGGWETLPQMLSERVLYVANSPSQIVDRLLPILGYRFPKEFVRFYIIRVPTYIYAVVGVALPAWLLWRNRLVRHGANSQLWALLLVASMLYLTMGSFWFQHWYVLWAILPAALLPWSHFTRWVLAFVCLGPLAANIIAGTLSGLPVMILSVIGLTGLVVAVIWLPGMVAGGIAIGRQQKRIVR